MEWALQFRIQDITTFPPEQYDKLKDLEDYRFELHKEKVGIQLGRAIVDKYGKDLFTIKREFNKDVYHMRTHVFTEHEMKRIRALFDLYRESPESEFKAGFINEIENILSH